MSYSTETEFSRRHGIKSIHELNSQTTLVKHL